MLWFFSRTPAGSYMFKVINRNTRTRCGICSKLTIKISERRRWRRSGIFIVNFEHISDLCLEFLLSTEQVNAAWDSKIFIKLDTITFRREFRNPSNICVESFAKLVNAFFTVSYFRKKLRFRYLTAQNAPLNTSVQI